MARALRIGFQLALTLALVPGAVGAGHGRAAPAPQAAEGWSWKGLHRPLKIPRIRPGSACPVNEPANFDFARYGLAAGIGPGPAYAVGLRQPGSVLEFDYPPSPASVLAGSPWGGNKVLWFVEPGYRGPLLVRGRQLDGAHGLRFELGRLPAKELRIAPVVSWLNSRGDRAQPSTTRVQAAGCYVWQLDGTSFSRTIVFAAKKS